MAKKNKEVGAVRLLKSICKGAASDLSSSEWDFSGCPPKERHECFFWELARHCPPVVADVKKLRANAVGESFEAQFQNLGMTIFKGTHRNYAIFYFCPEFPSSPYLKVDQRIREARRKIMWGGTEPCKRALARSLDARYYAILPWNLPELVRRAVETKEPIYRVGERELALLEINWEKPISDTKREFEAWWHENRPTGIKQWPDRGAGIPHRKRAYQLRQLGAWRLLRKMSWKQAAELSAAALDKPLLSEQSEWLEAEITVTKWIRGQTDFYSTWGETDSKRKS